MAILCKICFYYFKTISYFFEEYTISYHLFHLKNVENVFHVFLCFRVFRLNQLRQNDQTVALDGDLVILKSFLFNLNFKFLCFMFYVLQWPPLNLMEKGQNVKNHFVESQKKNIESLKIWKGSERRKSN